MLRFKRVGVLAVSWKTMHTPIKFDRHTSRDEWTNSDTNLGLSCPERFFCGRGEKIECAQEVLHANVIIVFVYTPMRPGCGLPHHSDSYTRSIEFSIISPPGAAGAMWLLERLRSPPCSCSN